MMNNCNSYTNQIIIIYYILYYLFQCFDIWPVKTSALKPLGMAKISV